LFDYYYAVYDTRLTASFPGHTSTVSLHQKGYTSLGFNEARDDGMAVA